MKITNLLPGKFFCDLHVKKHFALPGTVMYYTLYGKYICYSSFTLHFIESMLKLKYILQLFDRDYTLVCAGCENVGQI